MNKHLIAALLFGIEGVLFWAFVMPQVREFAGARQSLDAREELLEDTTAAQRNISELSAQYAAQEANIARVLLALPKSQQHDYLTESFQAAASANGLQLVSLTIGDAQKGKGNYQTIPVKAELRGSYPEFVRFLDTMEHSLRLLDITKFDVTEAGTISIQGNAYSLK